MTDTKEPGAEPLHQSPEEEKEKLAERLKVLIGEYDRVNQESLKEGGNRFGWLIGEGDQRVFILAKPIDVKAKMLRLRHYLCLTQDGIKAIVFNKGEVNPDGTPLPRVAGDERYRAGESAFKQALQKFSEEFEEKDGERTESYGYMNKGLPNQFALTYDHRGGRGLIDEGKAVSIESELEFREGKDYAGNLRNNVPEKIVEAIVKINEENISEGRGVGEEKVEKEPVGAGVMGG